MEEKDLFEKTYSSNVVFDGKIMKVNCDEVLLSNGQISRREVVHHNGGSTVLCEMDGKILFVKQYRYSVGTLLYEVPAGKLEQGENPRDTAIRELKEEGGIIAKDVKLICAFYPTPGYSSEKIYIYQALGVEKGEACLDENEFLTNEWISVSRIPQMIENGEITDGKTIIALQHYLLCVGENK